MTTQSAVIRVAHSPDADDAFMFWAMAAGKIDTQGRRYAHELGDIESLNRRALAGELEVRRSRSMPTPTSRSLRAARAWGKHRRPLRPAPRQSRDTPR